MTTQKVILIIFAIYLTIFLAHALYLKKTIYGDGIFYYTWLRSAIIDHDVNFANEYKAFGVAQPLTVNGFPRNIYSIGPAMLWMPFFVFAHSVFRGQGYEFFYQTAIGVSGVFYAITGLILVYRVLIKYFEERVSALAILGLAFGTHLLFYGSVDTVNSHVYTFFAASVFLSLLFCEIKNWFALGFSLGLIGIIRMQDLIYAVLLIPFLERRQFPRTVIGFITILLPQLIIWQVFHGNFLESPYFSEKKLFFMPFEPKVIEILFAPTNGLYLWTPLLLVATAGFLSMRFKQKSLNFLVPLIVFIQVYVISIRNEWWQEASFSGRMFLSMLPLFALGLARALESLHVRILILLYFLTPFFCLNLVLLAFYLSTH